MFMGNLRFLSMQQGLAEFFVEEFQRQFGLKYTIPLWIIVWSEIRYDKRIASNCKKTLETGVLQYMGAANTMREHIFVEDAARASVSALNDDFINRVMYLVMTGLRSKMYCQ